ncbi:MBL fold metallo-hydrolase [Desulfobacula phenolica]|uniref:Metallo-beta-lactamase superfamily protein n=1 Tax=Desulfobacula phenolica TaxID=90732 RepID=A0A1H2E3J8_9BACT|nr:MBL fold metallo-hydrolase [Desulfobacula phenolica]SDT89625.1 Metallo-beta-lactamase superfamily protein [Desulfobacula phenolica]
MLHSSKKINKIPPGPNEFEISLFGPGVGECIVLHLGKGKWLIVDSCLNPKTKKPISTEYLKSIGVTPAESVEVLVITHWHSDHIRGAAQIVSECSETRVCYPAALLENEFLSFLSAYSGSDITPILDKNTSATKEFASIVVTLKKHIEANPDYKYDYLSPIMKDTLIFEEINDDLEINIRALSPSSKSYHDALQLFASLLPKAKDLRNIIPAPKQNDNAIVLWVQINDICLLLGSDLEETKEQRTGWTAIVNSKQRPQRKASIFKIPHHGSENGHSDDVWEKMVNTQPVCLLTSKIGGRGSIPKESDIERIKAISPVLFCTKVPKGKKPKRENTVEKMLKATVKERHILDGEVGHIQLRFSDPSEIEVNCLPPATSL